MAGVSMRDQEVRDYVQHPAGRQSCAEEGSQIPLLTQMQNDLRQLESAGADSDIQCDLDAVDAVRYDPWSQHAGRGGPDHVQRPARRQSCAVRRGVILPYDTNADWLEAA
jgi:hypothetical protein